MWTFLSMYYRDKKSRCQSAPHETNVNEGARASGDTTLQALGSVSLHPPPETQPIVTVPVSFAPPTKAQEESPLTSETLAIVSTMVPPSDQNNEKALTSFKKYCSGSRSEIKVPPRFKTGGSPPRLASSLRSKELKYNWDFGYKFNVPLWRIKSLLLPSWSITGSGKRRFLILFNFLIKGITTSLTYMKLWFLYLDLTSCVISTRVNTYICTMPFFYSWCLFITG